MVMSLRTAVFFVSALASCSARSEERRTPDVPVYPFWNAAQLPKGPSAAPWPMPLPAGSATLIAPGYLLTSVEAMGDVAVDLDMDPSVYVFDGKVWHKGEYVDRDFTAKLALIRAAVPGRPMTVARDSRAVGDLVAIPWAKAMDRPIVRERYTLRRSDCPENIWGRRLPGPAYCFFDSVRSLSGGPLVDGQGSLAGLQVNATHEESHAAASAEEIRDFVGKYFDSWGRDAKDKPKL